MTGHSYGSAVPLQAAARASRHALHRQVQQALSELSELTAGLLDAASGAASGQVRHASADEIASTFAALAATAGADLLDVRPARWGMPSGRAAATRHRVLLAAPPDRPGAAVSLRGPATGGVTVRTLDWVPVRLAVADARTVAVAVDQEPSCGYLLLERDSQLARCVADLAELWWNRAEPVGPPIGRVSWRARSATEAAIMSALVRGDTDETVARRLGITPRTVRRYVADVSERFGATSRLQLGVLLGRSEAVCDQPDHPGLTGTAAG